MWIDTSMYKELATKGAEYRAKGFKRFGEWADEMKKNFGQEISPHLIKIWDLSKEIRQEVKESENSPNYNLNKREEVKIKTINGDESEIKVLNTLSKLTFKDKIFDVIFFIGGTFVSIVSFLGGMSHSMYGNINGLKSGAVIGVASGICLIVFGFLRRGWNKKEKGKK